MRKHILTEGIEASEGFLINGNVWPVIEAPVVVSNANLQQTRSFSLKVLQVYLRVQSQFFRFLST